MRRLHEEFERRRRKREWQDAWVDGALWIVGGGIVIVCGVIGWYNGGV